MFYSYHDIQGGEKNKIKMNLIGPFTKPATAYRHITVVYYDTFFFLSLIR